MKNKKPWSAAHEKLYSMLYNYYKMVKPTIVEFTFIEDNKRHLKSIIEKNDKWGNSTKEQLYFMVARYLENFDNKNVKYVKIYKQLGYDLMQSNRQKENDNLQDEKEIENYKSHEYFINLLNNIKPDEIKTKIGHYQYLLLNLLVLQPPLRTSFYITAQFLRKISENDKTTNYIWINKKGSLKVYYIVNNDKVSKTKTYAMNKNLNYIKLENEKLISLINESYEKYPRKYLFELDEKPITNPTYLNWLRKITDVKNINNDIMRSSYINWFYDNNKTLTKKESLSTSMRHSVLTAQRNYLKVFDENDKVDAQLDDKIKTIKTENETLKNKLENCTNEHELNDAQFNKRRRDVIYKAKLKKSEIKDSTLAKYKIKFDDTSNKYI
jgi:hypothetical protein